MSRARLLLNVLCLLTLQGCKPHAASSSPAASAASSQSSSPATVPVTLGRINEGRSITSNDGGFLLVYATHPSPIPMNQPFTIDVRIDVKSSDSKQRLGLAVDASMPEHGHGMNVEPKVTDEGGGLYRVENLLFHMPGHWEIDFDITRDGVTSRAQDEIVIE